MLRIITFVALPVLLRETQLIHMTRLIQLIHPTIAANAAYV
jgi:hypothetical protein